jgi:hypothetical protein
MLLATFIYKAALSSILLESVKAVLLWFIQPDYSRASALGTANRNYPKQNYNLLGWQ